MRGIALLAGLLTLYANAAGAQTCAARLPKEFKIELIRIGTDIVNDHGTIVSRIFGDIGVNNANMGRFYENSTRKVVAGTYRGVLRYRSDHNFVQSSCGQISTTRDFLLEVTGVKNHYCPVKC
jgi:hypothetical protein